MRARESASRLVRRWSLVVRRRARRSASRRTKPAIFGLREVGLPTVRLRRDWNKLSRVTDRERQDPSDSVESRGRLRAVKNAW
jgi:hypothetical protein